MSNKPGVSDAEAALAVVNYEEAGSSQNTEAMRYVLENFLDRQAAQPALQAEPVKVRLLTDSEQWGVPTKDDVQRALLAKITADTGIKFLIVEGEAK